MRSSRAHVVLLVTVFVSAAARADDDERKPDKVLPERPGVTRSPEAVTPGHAQIESGIELEHARSEDSAMTPTLLRIGLVPSLEARVEFGGVGVLRQAVDENTSTLTTLKDVRRTRMAARVGTVSVGAKWAIVKRVKGAALLPAIGLIGHLHLPSGTGERATRAIGASVWAVMDWKLAWNLRFAVMPGLVVDGENLRQEGPAGFFTATLGRQFFDRFLVFGELASDQFRPFAHDNSLTVDGGMAYTIIDRVQVDAMVRAGMLRGEPGFTEEFGLSVRL